MDEVIITFAPVPPVQIQIDMGKLTWKDVRRIESVAADGAEGSANDVLGEIIHKCTGLEVDDLPAYAIQPIMQAILGRVQGVNGAQKN